MELFIGKQIFDKMIVIFSRFLNTSGYKVNKDKGKFRDSEMKQWRRKIIQKYIGELQLKFSSFQFS